MFVLRYNNYKRIVENNYKDLTICFIKCSNCFIIFLKKPFVKIDQKLEFQLVHTFNSLQNGILEVKYL